MTILRVYDTMRQAKREAEYGYWICKDKGYDVKYRAIHPYKIEYGDDSYIYMVNRAECCLGWRVDKIEDYTTWGLSPEIRACQRVPFEREYEVKWE